MRPLLVSFVGLRGRSLGAWQVVRSDAVRGAPLAAVECVAMVEGNPPAVPGIAQWTLRGVTSNHRYVTHAESDALSRAQSPLGRPEATHAALIPIVKSEAWWELSQDERRAIFEDRSHHVSDTLRYLPAIARRLHHGRDLGEPFDFLTWFEWSPDHDALFEELVAMLRATEEWSYVEREVDIRLARGDVAK